MKPNTQTLVVDNVDISLLKEQAKIIGRIMDNFNSLTKEECEALEGVWNLLHTLLDDAVED